MKTNQYKKYMAAVLLAGAPMLWSACTDDWNEHYDVLPGGMAEQPSLLEKIQADPNLANFYRVITTIGGAETLNSPQQLTVWAPLSMTEKQADSVINVYREDEAAGVKLIDNRAIKQFMQNHVALYARPISSLTDTNIVMLNKKYMRLVGKSATAGSIENNPFNAMEICNNGILYKTQNLQTFYPNIREYAELNGMDSIADFLKQYDKYTLDETASVEGGIIDGKTIYLDSVTVLSNQMLSRYGLIQREDSDYIFIAPTNAQWEKEFNQYKTYYNYTNTVNRSDSLQRILAQLNIYEGRFFNMSKTSKHNQHPEDSLTNTLYYEHQIHNPRKNVFYDPENTILSGLKKVNCSNGTLYVDDKGAIKPQKTFFTRQDMQAEGFFDYEVPQDDQHNDKMRVTPVTRYISTIVDSTFNKIDEETGDSLWTYETKPIKEYRYVEITANNASDQVDITYTLPSTYSNVYYNMYVVTMPGRGTNANVKDYLSSYFTVECQAQDVNGKFQKCGSDASGNRDTKNDYLVNPHTYDEDSPITGYKELKGQSNFNRVFVTKSEEIDTILIAKAKMFDISSYGVDKGVVTLHFKSFGPNQTKQKEVIYTRTLRFDEIILVPFETKEEAEAAADDLDALNDELLELIKGKDE